jgi:hypothetical protein
MTREKIGTFLGIDIVVDATLPDDVVVIHNAREAYVFKGGRAVKVELQQDWASESLLAGRGLL